MAHEHQPPPGEDLPKHPGPPEQPDNATPARIHDQASGEGSNSALERMRELDKRKASSESRDGQQMWAGGAG